MGLQNDSRQKLLPAPGLFLKVRMSCDRRLSIGNVSQNKDVEDITSTELRCDCGSSLSH